MCLLKTVLEIAYEARFQRFFPVQSFLGQQFSLICRGRSILTGNRWCLHSHTRTRILCSCFYTVQLSGFRWRRVGSYQQRSQGNTPFLFEQNQRSLSKNRRAVLHKALKRLEKSHSFELQEYSKHSLEYGISEFFNLHQRRWQAVDIRSRFVNPKMREFYRDIASLFITRGWLHLSSITIDGEIASSVLALIYQRKFYGFFMARNKKYDKYSVGHIHIMYLIKNAINGKLKEFDLLQGDEPYKLYWTQTTRKYLRVVLIRRGLFPWLYTKYLTVTDCMKKLKTWTSKR